jgi:CHASE3 domain sensor protein
MTTAPSGFAERSSRVKKLIGLIGIITAMVLGNAVLTLFLFQEEHSLQAGSLGNLRKQMDSLGAIREAQVHFKKQVQEWKNILLRGHNPDDFKKYVESFKKEAAEVDSRLKTLHSGQPESSPYQSEVESLRSQLQNLNERYLEALKSFQSDPRDTPTAVDAKVRGMDREPTHLMDQLVEIIEKESDSQLVLVQEEAARRYQSTRRMVMISSSVTIALILISLGLALNAAKKS